MEVETSSVAVHTTECHSPLANQEIAPEIVPEAVSELQVTCAESIVDDAEPAKPTCEAESVFHSEPEIMPNAYHESLSPVPVDTHAVALADADAVAPAGSPTVAPAAASPTVEPADAAPPTVEPADAVAPAGSPVVAPADPPAVGPVVPTTEPVKTCAVDSSTKNVGKYKLVRTIGKGNFAKVKLAIHMATGVEVAIKIINKTKMDTTLLKRLKREISIMKATNHPNIVRLLEIIENEDVLCLVMEYASGGEIFDYLVSNGRMREKEARAKFRQLLSAVQYCHSKRIVHRDLKAENILLDGNLNVKVADFGLANTFAYDQRLTTFCGSPPYAAPELFLGIPYYGPGVDIWSMGVILFTLVLGHLPFDARDLRELRSKIIGLNYTIPRTSVSPECEALLRKMLVLDPRDRSSLKLLMQDKWVNMGYAPNEILRPYKEPPRHQLDEIRVKAMEAMGFTRADLEASVVNPEYDHVYATYHLLPETPSRYILLYEQLLRLSAGPTGPDVSLPSSLMASDVHSAQVKPTEPTKPVTSIGRFTVVPSGIGGVPTGQKQAGVASPFPPHVQDKSIGFTPATDAASREHHSLSSALPVALKRAFIQMGRTLGGANMSVTSGQSDASPRAGAGRVSVKPHIKNIDDRSIITAAPVPITAGKRPSASIMHQKRASPSPFAPNTPTPAPRSSSSDRTSATNTISGPRGASVTQTVAGTSRSSASKAQRLRKKQTKPSSSIKVSKSPYNPQEPSRIPVNPPGGENHPSSGKRPDKSVCSKSSRDTTDSEVPSDCKSVVSSTTSSDSYNVYSRKSSVSVHDMWLANEPTGATAAVPAAIQTSSSVTEGLAVHATEEANTPIRHPSSVIDPTTHTSVGSRSPEGGRHSLPTDGQTHLKASRDVRDGEVDVHSRTPAPGSTSHTVSGGNTSTWTRGVLKALGGLFVPKSHDHHSHQSVTSGPSLKNPREVRFPWSVRTTSVKSADEVLKDIISALENTPGCRYSFDQHFPYLIRCSWACGRGAIRTNVTTGASIAAANPMHDSTAKFLESGSVHHCGLRDDPLHWEMEVCQLPHLHLRGVRLRRIRGSALQFRQIADTVMKAVHL